MPTFVLSILYVGLIIVIAYILLWGVQSLPKLNADVKQLLRVLIIVFAGIWVAIAVYYMFANLPIPYLPYPNRR